MPFQVGFLIPRLIPNPFFTYYPSVSAGGGKATGRYLEAVHNEDYFILQSECACEYQDPREVKERFIQFARILKHEITMREAEQLLLTKENADRLQSLISKLEAYYSSDEWKRDFADDEAGLLPKKLPRSVLSEDGIYNLLEEYKETSE